MIVISIKVLNIKFKVSMTVMRFTNGGIGIRGGHCVQKGRNHNAVLLMGWKNARWQRITIVEKYL